MAASRASCRTHAFWIPGLAGIRVPMDIPASFRSSVRMGMGGWQRLSLQDRPRRRQGIRFTGGHHLHPPGRHSLNEARPAACGDY